MQMGGIPYIFNMAPEMKSFWNRFSFSPSKSSKIIGESEHRIKFSVENHCHIKCHLCREIVTATIK